MVTAMVGGHPEVSPIRRYWSLLIPERRDLSVIVAFAMMDGILMLASLIAVETLVNTVAFGRYLQPVIVLALILFVFLTFAAGRGSGRADRTAGVGG